MLQVHLCLCINAWYIYLLAASPLTSPSSFSSLLYIRVDSPQAYEDRTKGEERRPLLFLSGWQIKLSFSSSVTGHFGPHSIHILFCHLCLKLSPVDCNSSLHTWPAQPPAGGGVHPHNVKWNTGESRWADEGSVVLINPPPQCVSIHRAVSIQSVCLVTILYYNILLNLLYLLVWLFPETWLFFSGSAFHYRVRLGFRICKVSLLVTQKYVSCGRWRSVLLPWQRLIFSLSDGGRNQTRLWSGGRHKHTNKLLMNSLCKEHNAFVPLVGCLVGWVDGLVGEHSAGIWKMWGFWCRVIYSQLCSQRHPGSSVYLAVV